MIVFGPHNILGEWLCQKIDYAPTKHFRSLGNITPEGKILGVVGFDAWNGASCQMHVAGEGNWLTRELLRCTFDYAFNVAKLNMVIGVIPSGNKQSLRFSKHVGFVEIANIKDGHPDGSLFVLELRQENCRYLEKKDGKQSYSCAA